MERDEVGARRVDPYHLLFQGGQFYLLGYSHERNGIRVFRLSRIRGKVSYATKAEHDFRRPEDFDPRAYANRADWQLGEQRGVAEIVISERIAWLIERHFGRYGEIRDPSTAGEATAAGRADPDGEQTAERDREGPRLFLTGYSSPRGVISWVLGLGANASLRGPQELTAELQRRLELLEERHAEAGVLPARRRSGSAAGTSRSSRPITGAAEQPAQSPRRGRSVQGEDEESSARADTAIRPERFARLVTLASILIKAGREGERSPAGSGGCPSPRSASACS